MNLISHINKLKSCFSEKDMIYALFIFLSVFFRLFTLFSSDLIPGINGGYYALQVRSVYENFHMSGSDLPFYFYFNAILLKLISALGIIITDDFIIKFLKVIDSICMPLMLILFACFQKNNKANFTLGAELIILSYLSFSLSPLMLIGDLQKNAFGIPFMFLYFGMLYQYLQTKKTKYMLLMVLTLMLISLIHFGVFIVSLLFLLFNVFQIQSKKKYFLSGILLVAGILIVMMFDYSRALRFLMFWNVIFEKPLLLQGPVPIYDLVNILFSCFLAFFVLRSIKRKECHLADSAKQYLKAFAMMLLILSFPLLDIEYFRRFSLFLFIFQAFSLVLLYPMMKDMLKRVVFPLLLLMIIFSNIITHVSELYN